jgi:hypothetical protein
VIKVSNYIHSQLSDGWNDLKTNGLSSPFSKDKASVLNAGSMYLDLLDDDTKFLKRYIWKMKVPLKIKVFMWFLHRKVILTKGIYKI